jgi:pyrroloquinoline-quinone synthase
VGALYAYERQVPQVVTSKIDGLKEHYGITDGPALTFFVVHGMLDVEHSGAEREMLGQLAADADPQPIEDATRRALDAWWDFLSAVDQPQKAGVAAGA